MSKVTKVTEQELRATILQILAGQTPEAQTTGEPAPAEFDVKVYAEAQGYALNRGRVVVDDTIASAIADVRKTGQAQVVAHPSPRNPYVVVFRDGDNVVVQLARKA